jgi:hypothetical protein
MPVIYFFLQVIKNKLQLAGAGLGLRICELRREVGPLGGNLLSNWASELDGLRFDK